MNEPDDKPMTKYGVVQPTDDEVKDPEKLRKTAQQKAEQALRDSIKQDPA